MSVPALLFPVGGASLWGGVCVCVCVCVLCVSGVSARPPVDSSELGH